MNRIVEILRRRDGLSQQEALDKVREVYEMLMESMGCPNEYEVAEDIMLNELGLEMDYIFDII